ncbi:MAG: hypothetical protein RL698_943 [Pseudomonadota bacterium]
MGTTGTRGRVALAAVAALVCIGLGAGPAWATVRWGNLQISGDLSAQNLVRMRTPSEYMPVQQRNTARIRLDYDFIKDDKVAGRWDSPNFLESVRFYMLYRGVYDSYYDFAPGGALYDFTGKKIPTVGLAGQPLPGSQSAVPTSARDAVKFENTLREAYMDLAFKGAPLSFRIGRQQIVWGETDNFRLLDRVNALDLTWHLQQETEIGHSWDQLRIPYWGIKGLYQVGNLGPVNNGYLEAFWNPGTWQPNKRRFLPYSPWSVPIGSPIDYAGVFPGGLASGTLYIQGDYARNIKENSQAGIRFGGQAPGSIDFTLAYIYSRYNGDDGANTALVQAILDQDQAVAAFSKSQVPAVYYTPYTHNVGFSMNYFDDFTEAVLKTEQVFVMGMPFNSGDLRSPILPAQLFGTKQKNMWQGMIGFDRPTWVRWLNPRATWLILGQFFWHYLIDNEHSVGNQVGLIGNLIPNGQSNLVQRGTGAPCNGPNFDGCKARDTVRDWELLATIAATSFYLSGTLVPQLTYAIDPVNSFNMMVAWSMDYYVTNDIIANIGQRYYINTTEAPVYETWGLGGVNRGRNETQVRLTWQF